MLNTNPPGARIWWRRAPVATSHSRSGALRVARGHDVLLRPQYDRPRPFAVSGEDVAHLPGCRVPQPHGVVARARDEHVAAVDHREHPAPVALQRAQRSPGHGAAHQHAAVVAADRQGAAVGPVGQRLGQPAEPDVEAVPDADGGRGELGADRARRERWPRSPAPARRGPRARRSAPRAVQRLPATVAPVRSARRSRARVRSAPRQVGPDEPGAVQPGAVEPGVAQHGAGQVRPRAGSPRSGRPR